jgi:hypothetical protein
MRLHSCAIDCRGNKACATTVAASTPSAGGGCVAGRAHVGNLPVGQKAVIAGGTVGKVEEDPAKKKTTSKSRKKEDAKDKK